MTQAPLYFCGGGPSEPGDHTTSGVLYSNSTVWPGATLIRAAV